MIRAVLKDRTHTCGALRGKDEGRTVVLKGWVHRRRDHGGVIFIDLRDRYGLTQVVFRPEESTAGHKSAERVRSEFVISISGKVAPRPKGMMNASLPTGEIEVIADDIEILAESKTLPFSFDDGEEVGEVLRLKYRYLDLRRPELQRNLLLRHQIARSIRTYLDRFDFADIETPFLTKSTPEGARDFLVPSRVHPGKFFALPQSPQLFKQLLMVAGFDRYYQIVRCFRDEDLRADRQPEFTQLDLEMTYATPEGVQTLIEGLFVTVLKETLGVEIATPFPRLSYSEAIDRYGTDKPDLRWPIEMPDLSPCFAGTEFRVFSQLLAAGGEIRGFALPQGGSMARNQLDQLIEKAKAFGAKGLVWIKDENGKRTSSVAKVISERELEAVAKRLSLCPGGLALLVADQPSITRAALQGLRDHCVEKLHIAPNTKFSFLWVVDFPLLMFDAEEKRYVACHHPFTHPHPDDVRLLEKNESIEKVRALAYDIVLNGFEVGGGSIRIHKSELQQLLFERLGIGREEAEKKFGFLLEAFQYGAPPHGGIALGLDRIAMILAGSNAIRDVIAFPKTQSALDLMTNAPSETGEAQLKELSIRVARTEK